MSILASLGRNPWVSVTLTLAGLMLVATGYWGPWVWAEPAGLRVLGLDLAEYVKFVAEVRSGHVHVVREVFYFPLVALSLSLSLLAHRRELWLPRAGRWLLNLLAVPVALAMLPPAWTPALIVTSEFVRQTIAIGLCVVAAGLSYPLLRRLPGRLVAGILVPLALLAVGPMVASFARLRGPLDGIYGRPIEIGHGPAEMSLGFALLCTGYVLALNQARRTHV